MTEGTIAQVLAKEATWCVVEGDCIDVMEGMPDASVDHVITDPPYDAYVHAKSRAGSRKVPLLDGNGRMSRAAISREVEFGFDGITQAQRESVADHVARISKRWSLAFCDVESSHLWRGAFTSAGLDYCRTGAWIKVGATPQFTGDRPGVGFEAVVCCHPKGRKKWNGGGTLGVWTHITCIERGGKATSNDSRVHPTQKPLLLMMELVEKFTNPGDIVLDPFCGSGTTGAACIRLGRRFIGCEKMPEHVNTARQRCDAETDGSSIRDHRAGQIPMFGAVSK